MNRRQFLISSAVGGGLLLTARLGMSMKIDAIDDQPWQLNAYIEVGRDNSIRITAPVPEIGQGVRTSLPMLAAEEMGVDWTSVSIVQAVASDEFEGRWQRAAGSLSVRVFWLPMRRAGAIVRDLMIRAAADEWQLPLAECNVASGMVRHAATSRSATFGALASRAAALTPDENIALKNEQQFELVGKPVANVDAADIVEGKSKFGIDTRIPAMVFASVVRCPVYGGTPIRWDDEAARDVDGYLEALPVEAVGNPDRPYVRAGVAVLGETTWACLKAREALAIDWDYGPNTGESTDRLHETCLNLVKSSGEHARNDGDVDLVFSANQRSIESTYHLPFIVHTPMETMNCTAHVQDDRVQIWVPTQMPLATQSSIASSLSIPVEQVEVNVTRVGGGFGRRLSTDFVTEAVQLSKQSGRPVQVVWTREDEIAQGEFRPFSYHRLRGSLDDDNQVIGWRHRQAGTSRYAFRNGRNPADSEFFENAFPAGLVPNLRLEYALAASNLPRTIIRAPGHNALAFAIESFVDELAHLAADDPLTFRLRLYGNGVERMYNEEEETGYQLLQYDRLAGVVARAADAAGWSGTSRNGQGKGIACHYTFGTYVAHVVEVTTGKELDELRITRVTSAIDCGYAVNPNGVEAQIQGAVIDGLSAALYGEISVVEGRVQQDNFDSYRLLRLEKAPEIDVHIVDSGMPLTGAGEPGYPPVAAALCNAIFAASGQRYRDLPLMSAANRAQAKKDIAQG